MRQLEGTKGMDETGKNVLKEGWQRELRQIEQKENDWTTDRGLYKKHRTRRYWIGNSISHEKEKNAEAATHCSYKWVLLQFTHLGEICHGGSSAGMAAVVNHPR